MELKQARELALDFVRQHDDVPGDEPVIGDDYTITKGYEWVFFYGSRRFIETGDPKAQIAGNGPVVVLKAGEIVPLPAAYSPDDAVRHFERERGLVP